MRNSILGKALKSLKKKAASKHKILQLTCCGRQQDRNEVLKPYLRRMGLEAPNTLEEKFYARLLGAELGLLLPAFSPTRLE